jgi:hypothetical protein
VPIHCGFSDISLHWLEVFALLIATKMRSLDASSYELEPRL